MLQQGPGAGKFAGTEDNNHFRGKKRGSVFFQTPLATLRSVRLVITRAISVRELPSLHQKYWQTIKQNISGSQRNLRSSGSVNPVLICLTPRDTGGIICTKTSTRAWKRNLI